MAQTIVIVNDSPYVNMALAKVIKNNADFQVLGHAKSGSDAYTMVQNLRPDIVLIDSVLPDALGLHLAKELKQLNSGLKIILMSAVSNSEAPLVAKSNGADYYVLKPLSNNQLISALVA